jgi:Uma2 family endonuclease
MVLAERERTYTVADLAELEALPENADVIFELINGVLHPMAGGTSAKPTVYAAYFVTYLNLFVIEHNLGYVTGADGEFEITPDDRLIPDAAFVSRARLPALPDGRFTLAPDLAVEVVSPSDNVKKVLDKVRRYLELGTRMVWIAYPEDRSVDVCTLAADGGVLIHKVDHAGMLSGGDVLPGFTLALSKVFPQ